jgi:serine/threonine-protein kinase
MMEDLRATGADSDGLGRWISPEAAAVQTAAGEAAPRPGQVLGHWRLSRALGRGGMGVVFAAEHVALPRQAAVKVLTGPSAADPTAVQRFLREARSAARLDHPHVVQVIDVGRDGGFDFIVMELVDGLDAETLVDRHGALPWRQAVGVAAAAARALQAAHEAGLVHRDVKPGNILIRIAGPAAVPATAERRVTTVKLTDFGLAKSVTGDSASLTAADRIMGTPDYLSPEQAQARPLDRRTDVYSLGATLHHLLTGKVPYHDVEGGPMEVALAHCHDPPPDPRRVIPDLPAGCAAVVLRAMQKSPAERFPTAAAMADALEGLLAGGAGPALPPRSRGRSGAATLTARNPVVGAATSATETLSVLGRPAAGSAWWVWAVVAPAVSAIGLGAAVGIRFAQSPQPAQPAPAAATDPTNGTGPGGTGSGATGSGATGSGATVSDGTAFDGTAAETDLFREASRHVGRPWVLTCGCGMSGPTAAEPTST